MGRLDPENRGRFAYAFPWKSENDEGGWKRYKLRSRLPTKAWQTDR